MLVKDKDHQQKYRNLYRIWGERKSTDKERACLYIGALDDELYEGLYKKRDVDIFKRYESLISRVALYILGLGQESITIDEILSDENAAYIIQAFNIAYPILRTGHANVNKAGRKSALSETTIKKFVIDRENGMSFKEISDKYGIPKTTIQYYCKNAKKAR